MTDITPAIHEWSTEALEDLLSDVVSVLSLRRSQASLSARLAEMPVGASVLFTEIRDARDLRTADKRNARKRLRAFDAQWVARSRTNGVRVTRVR